MQKLAELKNGVLFIEKGGRVLYLTNEQLDKTGYEQVEDDRGRKSNQLVYDAAMQALKKQKAIEPELSVLFSLGFEELAERPVAVAAEKAVKKTKVKKEAVAGTPATPAETK
jgi:3-hydroxymyristoyl/3-hydroxydecanoyl-(acyl carrier protein) dehydratase